MSGAELSHSPLIAGRSSVPDVSPENRARAKEKPSSSSPARPPPSRPPPSRGSWACARWPHAVSRSARPAPTSASSAPDPPAPRGAPRPAPTFGRSAPDRPGLSWLAWSSTSTRSVITPPEVRRARLHPPEARRRPLMPGNRPLDDRAAPTRRLHCTAAHIEGSISGGRSIRGPAPCHGTRRCRAPAGARHRCTRRRHPLQWGHWLPEPRCPQLRSVPRVVPPIRWGPSRFCGAHPDASRAVERCVLRVEYVAHHNHGRGRLLVPLRGGAVSGSSGHGCLL